MTLTSSKLLKNRVSPYSIFGSLLILFLVLQVTNILRVVDMIAAKFSNSELASSMDAIWDNLTQVATNTLNSAYDVLDYPLEREYQLTFLFHQQALDDIALQVRKKILGAHQP